MIDILVRVHEMRESLKIIRQCLSGLDLVKADFGNIKLMIIKFLLHLDG